MEAQKTGIQFSSTGKPADQPVGHSRYATVFVWSVWGAMLIAAVGYVAAFGLIMPFADEWAWLSISTGMQTPGLDWFWSSHNGHRMLIPRLIYIATGTMTDYDFERMAFANVVTLAAAAAMLMLAARRVRGRSDLADVIFSVVLMHWGHEINLTWCFQMNYVTSTLLALVVLSMMVQCRQTIGRTQAGILSLVLCGMSLCGLFGLVMVPPVALWMLVAAAWSWYSGRIQTSHAVFIAVGALVPLGLAAACLHGLPPQQSGLQSTGLLATFDTAVKFLTTSVGPLGRALRPIGPWLVLTAVTATLGRLGFAWYQKPQERLRINGLFCFLLSVGLLAGAIGWGRAGIGPDAGYANRYGILAVPLVCNLFFAWSLYGLVNVRRQAVFACLVFAMLLVVVNDRKGYRDGVRRAEWMAQLQQDAEAGTSKEELAQQYASKAHIEPTAFVGALEALRISQRGPYSTRQ